jgi:uncharacterized membrane protein
MKKLRTKLYRYFIAGLAVTLPVVITCYILFIFFKFADGILGKFLNRYLKENLGYSIPGLGLFISLIFVLIIGIIARNFLVKRLFRLVEKWFLKLPFVNAIYPSAKQMIDFLFSKEKIAFKKVVMIEYPRKGVYSMGFITNEGMEEIDRKALKEMVSVFIASTPSPLTGYFVFVPKEEVIFLDMTVEEAIKLIVSAGIISPARYKAFHNSSG